MLSALDRLLRGQFTSPDSLRSGAIPAPVGVLALACVVLGAIYGASMGLFAGLLREDGAGWIQVFASAVKVPLLFLSTLVVTFPSLYVVSALGRSRLRALDTLKLLLVAIAVTMALLASLAPVTAFFTLSTDSYPFMVLLNVFVFGVSGLVGLAFLLRALRPLLDTPVDTSAVDTPPPRPADANADGDDVHPAARRLTAQVDRIRADHNSRTVFRTWAVIYGVVGAQMGWILRPFIGNPDLPFTWFRERESNFLSAVLRALNQLLSA